MFPKRLFLPALLVVAIALPIALHEDGLGSLTGRLQKKKSTKLAEPKTETKKSTSTTDMDELHRLAKPTENLGSGTVPIEGTPVSDLSEVIRFNITPEWVMQRWPRVTAELSDLDLEGLRVPLVTGTARHDLAGSLTYYFDDRKYVQRITFHGFTADEQPLVELLVKHCVLRPEPTLGRGLYLAKWSGIPRSALWVRHAPVIDASQQFTQLELELELNRPGRGYRLSKRFNDLLTEQQMSGRW